MNIQFFTFGCLLLLAVGMSLAWHAWARLLAVPKIKKQMLSVPILALEVRVMSIEKVSRFRLTEFALEIRYEYKFGGRDCVGKNLYIEGDVRHNDKREAEECVAELERMDSVYCNPLLPEFSTVYLEMSQSRKSHYYAVFVGGGLVFSAGLLLLLNLGQVVPL